jgi:hypothetical protein
MGEGFVDILRYGLAVEALEIRTAQQMVVDAVLMVEAGVGRHLMSSHHHRPRWRASQHAGLGTALVVLPETVRRRGEAGGGGAWSCMRRQRRARCGR